MASDDVAHFVIRRRPYVAKAIGWHWRRGHQWGPGYYECILTSDESGCVDKESMAQIYDLLIDVYKHWLVTILKYNTAYYLLTGAMVSFYLAKGLNSFIGVSLLLPLAIGIALASYSHRCVVDITKAEKNVAELKKRLDAKNVPDMSYLVELLRWSSRGFVIVAISLGVLVFACFIRTGLFRWFIDIFPK